MNFFKLSIGMLHEFCALNDFKPVSKVALAGTDWVQIYAKPYTKDWAERLGLHRSPAAKPKDAYLIILFRRSESAEYCRVRRTVRNAVSVQKPGWDLKLAAKISRSFSDFSDGDAENV